MVPATNITSQQRRAGVRKKIHILRDPANYPGTPEYVLQKTADADSAVSVIRINYVAIYGLFMHAHPPSTWLPGKAILPHHIFSGAETPRIDRASPRTIFTALQSASLAIVVSLSSEMTLCR